MWCKFDQSRAEDKNVTNPLRPKNLDMPSIETRGSSKNKPRMIN